MRLRTDISLSTQKLLEDGLYQPLRWPWKTLRLERNSLDDYRGRSTSQQVSIAELWHENSKLWPRRFIELVASRIDVPRFRLDYVHRRGRTAAGNTALPPPTGALARSILAALKKAIDPELFYALDLRLIEGDCVTLYEPVSNNLEVVKYLSPDDRQHLAGALWPSRSLDPPTSKGTVLLIIGSFARNEILFGSRGHRRTILEGGQMAQAVVSAAQQVDIKVQPIYEFTDRAVDAVIDADGTEEATLAAFQFPEVEDVH